jgi:hypothetical protein
MIWISSTKLGRYLVQMGEITRVWIVVIFLLVCYSEKA